MLGALQAIVKKTVNGPVPHWRGKESGNPAHHEMLAQEALQCAGVVEQPIAP
jgi:hypothetical protein